MFNLKNGLLLVATVLGGASQLPGLNPLVAQGLVAVAGFFAGWAGMKQPGQSS